MMLWFWPRLDWIVRRKQISGHYSKVGRISEPISSWIFARDAEQNQPKLGDGVTPEITPIHFNYIFFPSSNSINLKIIIISFSFLGDFEMSFEDFDG